MKRSVADVAHADTENLSNADNLKDQCVQDVNEDNIQRNYSIDETAQCFHEDFLKQHSDVPNENEDSYSSESDTEEAPIIPLHVISSCIKCKIQESESSKICYALSKFCSAKLKDVLASAVKYKERWDRKKLTVQDFNKGLFFCGEEPVYEFPDVPLFKKTKQRKRKKLHVPIIKPEVISISNTKLDTTISVSRAWLGNDDFLSSDIPTSNLPKELILYFNLVTNHLLNLEEESLTLALEDLKLNKNISCLVPFFNDFFISKIDELTHSDLQKLTVVLRAAGSLVANPCLYFREDSYLKQLSHTLIKCLLDPLQYYLNGDFWLLKDTIAELLANVLQRSKSEALTFEIIFFLEAAFCDRELPLISHYGAVAAVNSIGVPAINLVIIPHIDSYLAFLNLIEMDSSIGFPERYHACVVQSQLSHSYYLLIKHFLKHKFDESHFHFGGFFSVSEDLLETRIPVFLKESFTEYFGDALVQCFPLWNFASCNMSNITKNKIIIKNSSKMKYFKNVNSKLREKVTVKNGNTVDKLRPSMFDYHPLKKCVIKFDKLLKNNMS